MTWPLDIRSHEAKIFSQNGEDGILRYIFERVGTTNKRYVEFGVQDGKERNTRWLREKAGWDGVLLDGGFDDPKENLHKEFIKPSNIRHLFEKYSVPMAPDLLSIDIDTTDLWVWRRLCDHHAPYRPRVVAIEFNRNCDLHEYWTFPNDPTMLWAKDSIMGACLSALWLAGRQMGYSLLYTDALAINAFFLRDDVFEATVPPSAHDRLTLAALHPGAARPLHRPATRERLRRRVDYRLWSLHHNLTIYGQPAQPAASRRVVLWVRRLAWWAASPFAVRLYGLGTCKDEGLCALLGRPIDMRVLRESHDEGRVVDATLAVAFAACCWMAWRLRKRRNVVFHWVV